MITNKLLLLSISVIAILVFSTVSMLIPTVPRASAQQKVLGANWEYLNYDLDGTNFSPQTKITKDNVQNLELKWVWPFPTSSISAPALLGVRLQEGASGPPLIVDGIVYMTTNNHRITAMSAKDGKILWTYQASVNATKAIAELPIMGLGGHHHGVNYIDGIIYMNTFPCRLLGLDALSGKVVVSIENLCKDVPTNSYLYSDGNRGHPPVIDKKNGIMITSVGGGEGTAGARTFATAIEVKTGKILWRSFIQPPEGAKFPAEKAAWGQFLVDNCKKIWVQGFSSCDIAYDLRKDWGDMRFNSGVSNFWGHWPIDEESGTVFMSTAQPAPDWNATYRPGPNLMGASIVALDTKTGSVKWVHQIGGTHDLWDNDCSYNAVLGKIDNKKVVYKACKGGALYAMDAETGKALWVFDGGQKCVYPTPNARGAYPDDLKVTYANSVTRFPWTCFFDPRDSASFTVRWQRDPLTGPHWTQALQGVFHSDVAYAYGNLYTAMSNRPTYIRATSVDTRAGGVGLGQLPAPFQPKVNMTVFAIDGKTGETKWKVFFDEAEFRGGMIVSAGLVYVPVSDGTFYVLDAQTGQKVWTKYLGTPLLNQPTIGVDATGDPRLMMIIGGRTGPSSGNHAPGALMAYGLPDKLPEPQVITKEVIKEVPKEVVKEVVKEVPKEVIKEVVKEVPREVIKEVPKEVTRTVTVETIGPVTYGAIGVAVAASVVAGVVFSRRKKV